MMRNSHNALSRSDHGSYDSWFKGAVSVPFKYLIAKTNGGIIQILQLLNFTQWAYAPHRKRKIKRRDGVTHYSYGEGCILCSLRCKVFALGTTSLSKAIEKVKAGSIIIKRKREWKKPYGTLPVVCVSIHKVEKLAFFFKLPFSWVQLFLSFLGLSSVVPQL